MKKITFLISMILFAGISLDAQQDWQWAKKQGGSGNEYAYDVCSDPWGNTYVAGFFNGTATIGTTTLTSAGLSDVYLAKYDINGNVQWVTRTGGWKYDYPASIAVDNFGNTYVVGTFSDTTVIAGDTLVAVGSADVFVFKADASGNILWGKKGGTSNYDTPTGITCDNSGHVWITGYLKGSATFGAATFSSTSAVEDAFIVKYDTSGIALWGFSEGGSSQDYGQSIVCDQNENIFVTGYFGGTVNFGVASLTSVGSRDIFVAKYNASGSTVWAARAGGTSLDEAYGLSLDGAGNVFVGGNFNTTAIFGTDTLISISGQDVFIAKLNANGNFLWAERGGSSATTDYLNGVAADAFGNVYVSGSFYNTIAFGGITLTGLAGDETTFIVKYDSDGNELWGKNNLGGSNNTRPYGIATDHYGNVFVAGYFATTASFGTFSVTSSGSNDGFVARIGCGYSLSSVTTSQDASCYGDSTGSADVTVSGGIGAYAYYWYNSPSQSTASSVSGLNAGTYMVATQDSNACMVVDTVMISSPTQIVVASSSTGVSCSSCCDGSADVSVSGGTSPYSYTWMPGGLTGSTVSGLCQGTYNWCVIDANGCKVCDSLIIDFPAGISVAEGNSEISVYPNPFSENAFVVVPPSLLGKKPLLEMYDLTGKIVRTRAITDEKTLLRKSNLESGIYFYAIRSGAEIISAGKLIVE
jgi:hypothetical protein